MYGSCAGCNPVPQGSVGSIPTGSTKFEKGEREMKFTYGKAGGLIVSGNGWHGGIFPANTWFANSPPTAGNKGFCIVAFKIGFYFVNV